MFRSPSAKLGILGAVALAGCSTGQPDPDLARPEPSFDVPAFFSGRTFGDGRLKVMLKRAQRLNVEGTGRVGPDGTLILQQQVRRGDTAPKMREWRIRPLGGGRYAGSLTDADGPVAADVRGNALHLSYSMKDGMHAEQWIYLQPGGHIAVNRMAITKFGLTLATVEEAIRKVG